MYFQILETEPFGMKKIIRAISFFKEVLIVQIIDKCV